jgi:hypothetical protein
MAIAAGKSFLITSSSLKACVEAFSVPLLAGSVPSLLVPHKGPQPTRIAVQHALRSIFDQLGSLALPGTAMSASKPSTVA